MVSNIVLSAAAWASSLRSSFAERLKAESGQDLIEYAVLAGVIGAAAGAAFLLAPVGTSVTNLATSITNCLNVTAGGGYACP